MTPTAITPEAITPEAIIDRICNTFSGITPKATWGEISLFYNPGGYRPNGVYVCTIKQQDGSHDRASNLDREGVFRLSIGLPPEAYQPLFGQKPARPAKGGVVTTGHDFTQRNQLMPHPIYAWMGWVQILSPSQEAFEGIFPLIEAAYQAAVKKRAASLP